MLLITVLNVLLQESMLHLVTALMVSSTTVTLVLVVLINVLLVLIEKLVKFVLILELKLQLVNVHQDFTILVKPNVIDVKTNVMNVMNTTNVLSVKMESLLVKI
jgi:hypothetical protein